MRVGDVLTMSLSALRANLFRSALTMLGMTIGVAAVVVLVSLGEGARRFILGQFDELGTNMIIIQPGRTDRKSHLGPPVGTAQRKMTIEDVEAIERRARMVQAVAGLVFGSATVRHLENVSNASVFGTNEQFIQILNIKVARGDFFSREEDQYGRRLVVLGGSIAESLFGGDDPIGKRVKINQSDFRVLGVLEKRGSTTGFNFDDFAMIPTTAALRVFNVDALFGIRAKARSRADVDDAVEELREILSERRDGEEDFTIVTQGGVMSSLDSILSMLTWLLAAIAAVSMLVGGIGVMNIMLVSVTERIPEIGIRRAVGARRGDILAQFLTEAIVLASIGGICGVLVSGAITYGVTALYPNFDMRAPWWIVLPAFLVSALTGIVFGVMPARRAATIETLDALRRE